MSYNSSYFPIRIGEKHEKIDRIGLHYGIPILKLMLLHQEKRVKRNPGAM